MSEKFTCIDLFAGAGGLSRGLQDAGFKSLFASEIVPVYAETYRQNHPETEVLTADTRSVDPVKIMKKMKLEKGELDLIAGGPPCQGFSINAPVRSILDNRNHLFKEYLRFVDTFAPKALMIENVPGLVSFEHGQTLHSIINALNELGYGTGVHILGAAYYGVPQMRWRTIILGFRGNDLPEDAFPEPICQAPIKPNFTSVFNDKELVIFPEKKVKKNFVSVKEAIGDLPPLKNGEIGEKVKPYACAAFCEYQKIMRKNSSGVSNHDAVKLSSVNMQRLHFIKPGGNWNDIPNSLLPKGMQSAKKGDHTKRYGRVTPEGLSSTILTKCDPHWGAYFHYSQDRSFTVREAARIQSFPDDYSFSGNMAEQFAQVGNAVPPLLAKAVGKSIGSILK